MRMYFNFHTNIPDSKADLSTIQVETITFLHKDGAEINVHLYGEADYGVENGVYDARWKGLEFNIDGWEGEDDYWVSDDDATEEECQKIFDYLKDASLSAIEYYWENENPDDLKYWNVPDEDFTPTCEQLSVTITCGDLEHTWTCDKL